MKLTAFILALILLPQACFAALTDSLQAYYKTDESSGAAADSSGNGFNLTNTNTVGYSTGKINNASDYGSSNTNKRLEVASAVGMTGATLQTVNFWLNATTLPGSGVSNVPFLWSDQSSANNKLYWELQLFNNAGTQQLYINRAYNSGNDQTGTNFTLTAGTWYMITVTWDGSNQFLYINGSGSATITNPTTSDGDTTAVGGFSTQTILGADTPNGRFFSGLVDEVGIWSRVLSSSEITQLYNSGTGLQYPFASSSAIPFDANAPWFFLL